MAIVLQCDQAQGVDQAVGGITGDDVHFFFGKRAVHQTEVQHAGVFPEFQSVTFGPAAIAIGTFEKFIADTGAPVRGKRSDVRHFRQMIVASVVAAHDHGEGIGESQRLGYFQRKTALVFVFDATVNRSGIALRRFREYSGKRGAGVFDIKVNVTVEKSFVHQQSAAEIGFANDGDAGAGLDVLGEEFGEDYLFGEKFGRDDQVRSCGLAAGGENRDDGEQGCEEKKETAESIGGLRWGCGVNGKGAAVLRPYTSFGAEAGLCGFGVEAGLRECGVRVRLSGFGVEAGLRGLRVGARVS